MTLLLVFITLAFTAFTVFKMIAPFLGSRQGQLRVELLDNELRDIELLVARKAAIVQDLRDIEYDYQTSKISEEDYKRFKTSNERRAIGIMRRLDAIHGGRAWEQNINEELERRLAGENTPMADDADAINIEQSADSTIPAQATEPPATNITPTPEPVATAPQTSCEQCNKPLNTDDIFCAKCGHRVAAQDPTQDSESFSQDAKTTNKSLRPEVTQ